MISLEKYKKIKLKCKSSHMIHTLHITHYTLRITHYALRITHYALRITHYALRIMHYALYIIHYSSYYAFFKRTVHPGNQKNQRLLLDPYHLMPRSIVLAFVCTLPVSETLRRQAFNRKRLASKSLGYSVRLKVWCSEQ